MYGATSSSINSEAGSKQLQINAAEVAKYSRELTSQLSALRSETGFVNHDLISGLLDEVLSITSNTSVHSYHDDASGSEDAEDQKTLEYIKQHIVNAIQNKAGTTSYKPTIYNYLACTLVGVNFTKYFKEDDIKSLIYTNVLFVTTTLFSRYFYYQAASIEKSMAYFNAHYNDLNEYIEELFGLGFITKVDAKLALGEDVKKIGAVVLSVWSEFMRNQKITNLSALSDFRVADISMNMFKALSRYLIIERSEALKAEIRKQLGAKCIAFDVNDPNIDYVKLAKDNKLNIDGIIKALPEIKISEQFIKKVVSEFSAIIVDKSHKENMVKNLVKSYHLNHIGFTETPDIMMFLNGLNKIGYRSAVSGLNHEAGSKYIPEYSITKGITASFGMDLFFSDEEIECDESKKKQGENRKLIMKHIADNIKKKTGSKFPLYLNELLSIGSGMVGGVALFSYGYQKLVSSFISPLIVLVIPLFEKSKNLIANQEQRFGSEYAEYEKKVEQLANMGHITSVGVGNEKFTKSMTIISQIIEQTYRNAGISSNDVSAKENAFMAARLFNAFGDAILKLDDKIDFTDDSKIARLVGVISKKYSDSIERGWLTSISRGCFANASFAKILAKDELLGDIVANIGSNVSPLDIRQIAHAKCGNASNFASAHAV